MARSLVRVIVLVGLLSGSRSSTARADEERWTIERIVVKHRFAGDLDGPARAALSPTGTLVVDQASNSLIVRDTPVAVAALRALVAQLDLEPRQVTLRVRSVDRATLERSRSGFHGRASIDSAADTRVAVGMVLERGAADQLSRTTQTVTVQSGQRAQVFLGGTQPLTTGRGYGPSGLTLRDFGSELVVEPTVLGDGRIRVKLAPSATTPVDPRTGVARSAGLETEMVLSAGESIVVGGVEQQREPSSSSWPPGDAAERRAGSLVYLLDVTIDPGAAATSAPR